MWSALVAVWMSVASANICAPADPATSAFVYQGRLVLTEPHGSDGSRLGIEVRHVWAGEVPRLVPISLRDAGPGMLGADFLVATDDLDAPVGCPTRVPPGADALFMWPPRDSVVLGPGRLESLQDALTRCDPDDAHTALDSQLVELDLTPFAQCPPEMIVEALRHVDRPPNWLFEAPTDTVLTVLNARPDLTRAMFEDAVPWGRGDLLRALWERIPASDRPKRFDSVPPDIDTLDAVLDLTDPDEAQRSRLLWLCYTWEEEGTGPLKPSRTRRHAAARYLLDRSVPLWEPVLAEAIRDGLEDDWVLELQRRAVPHPNRDSDVYRAVAETGRVELLADLAAIRGDLMTPSTE